MTDTLLSIIASLVIAIGLPCAMVLISSLLGGPTPGISRKEQARKLQPYESGITSPVGTARERFSVKFYLVAMLFIVFDVEAVFLFPWAVNYRSLGLPGLAEMFVFIAVLFAGFIYILKKGALDWD